MHATLTTDDDAKGSAPRRRTAAAMRKARWVTIGCVLGALAGAAVGYSLGQPTYRSSAVIEFQQPDEATEASRESFDRYVRNQVETLGSAEIGGAPAAGMSATAAGFSAARVDGVPNQVAVFFADHDARTTLTRLAASLDAYRKSGDASRNAAAMLVKQELDKRQTAEGELAKVQERLAAIAAGVSPLTLDQVHAAKLTDLTQVGGYLSETRLALATLASLPAEATAGAPADERVRQLARADPRLQEILDRRDQLKGQIASLTAKLPADAPELATMRSDLAALELRIEQLAREAPTLPVMVESFGRRVAMTAAELRDREQKLLGLEQKTRSEAIALSHQLELRKKLEAEAGAIRARIDAAGVRAQRLTVDGRVGKPPRIALPAVPPAAPYIDPRPMTAAVGGVCGLVLALVLTMWLIRTDTRMRRPQSADLGAAASPLLGTVPQIGPEGSTDEETDLTALSIHQIRAMIEIRAKGDGAQAFAISSPSAGSGKTSLTVGLASSLAISGTRTLLVDCELASRVMGDAVLFSAESGSTKPARQSLGDVFAEMGYLDSDQVELFTEAPATSVGLVAMLDGTALRDCVIQTNMPGLAVLPVLSAQAHHVGKLSCKFIKQLIAQAKEDYDVILFDTGPIPGSVEALLVASEVDGVILVAAEGEMQSRFDHSVKFLGIVGAELLGTVFNRASRRDLSISAAKSRPGGKSASSARTKSIGPQSTGSGLFAAAVQAQTQTQLAVRHPSGHPAPADPDEATPEPIAAGNTNGGELSLRDAGSVADILDEPAVSVPPIPDEPAVSAPPVPADPQLEDAVVKMMIDAAITRGRLKETTPKPRSNG